MPQQSRPTNRAATPAFTTVGGPTGDDALGDFQFRGTDFQFRGTWKSAALLTVVPALLAALAVSTVDGPLAVASMHTELPHFVFTMIIHSEVFGDGCGVLFFFAAV